MYNDLLQLNIKIKSSEFVQFKDGIKIFYPRNIIFIIIIGSNPKEYKICVIFFRTLI